MGKRNFFISLDGLISDIAWQVIKEGHEARYYINDIFIPNMYYRTDIGERWFEDCDRLHTWGYRREI